MMLLEPCVHTLAKDIVTVTSMDEDQVHLPLCKVFSSFRGVEFCQILKQDLLLCTSYRACRLEQSLGNWQFLSKECLAKLVFSSKSPETHKTSILVYKKFHGIVWKSGNLDFSVTLDFSAKGVKFVNFARKIKIQDCYRFTGHICGKPG